MTPQCDPGDCDVRCPCPLTPAQAIERIRAAVAGVDEHKRRWQNGFITADAYHAALDEAIRGVRRALEGAAMSDAAHFEAEVERKRAILKRVYCDRGRHFWQDSRQWVDRETDEPVRVEFVCNLCQREAAVDVDGPVLTPDGTPYLGNPIIEWRTDDGWRIIEARNAVTHERIWPVVGLQP